MPVVFTYTPPKVNAGLVMHAAVAAAERAGAEVLLAASQPLVPVDTGHLLSTGRVEQDGHGAAVIYDALSPEGYPYGIRMHEDETVNHPHGGQPHFLADPMTTQAAAIMTAAAAVLREAT